MTDSSQDFETFLKEKKIDVDSLREVDPKSPLLDAEAVRTRGILRARMEAFPWTQEQLFGASIDTMGFMSDKLIATCYDICENPNNDTTSTNYQEGLCIRNCARKFMIFYPTLQRNANFATAHYEKTQTENMEKLAKKNPSVAKLLKDPFENEIKEKLMEYSKGFQAV